MSTDIKKNHPVLLRRPEVLARCGISSATLYRRIIENDFPPPISLGGRSVAWVEDEVNAWIESRIESSRSHGGTGHV